MRERLTKSEMAIMEILWEEGKGLTATEIVNIAGEKKTWKDSSIHLLINKLLDKGVIEVVGFRKTMKNYARTFFQTKIYSKSDNRWYVRGGKKKII